ncbi:MAG: hypothetical protein JW755_06900, partial [Candidatus Aminicenantes bacterium]|nr:hypothetical protein [Candidatus Aminicenantes bacterium]
EEATIYSEDVFTGTLISDAAVTINNIEIPFINGMGHVDEGEKITLIPGESYTVKIVYNGMTFEQTIDMPPAPTITSHEHYDPWDEEIANILTWDLASTNHDENRVSIYSFNTQSGEDYEVFLPAATTTQNIPAGTLIADSFPSIEVSARTKFIDFDSDYTDGSFLLFTYEESVTVDTFDAKGKS